MVLYDKDGKLYKKFHVRENGANVYEHPGEVSNIKYKGDSDNRLPDEGHLGDNAAGRLEFDLNIPSDRYYIYGVANVKDFGSKDISTRDRLKNIECKWDSLSIANNSEMFGIFSIGQNRGASDNDPIAVTVRNDKAQQLHCWLRLPCVEGDSCIRRLGPLRQRRGLYRYYHGFAMWPEVYSRHA